MPPSKKHQREAAARARAARHPPKPPTPLEEPSESQEDQRGLHNETNFPAMDLDTPSNPLPPLEPDFDLSFDDSDSECGYEGGVDHEPSDDEYLCELDRDSDFTDSDLSEFDEEMIECLKKELEALAKPTPFEKVRETKSNKEWAKAEANRGLGYNGHSERTTFRRNAEARERETKRKAAKMSKDPQIVMMRNMFAAKPRPATPAPARPSSPVLPEETEMSPADMVDYQSDHSDSESEDGNDGDDEHGPEDENAAASSSSAAVPPRKRCKLDVPVRQERRQKQEARQLEFKKALNDIQQHIKSKKTKFVSGKNSLQEYRARAIQSYLIMVVKRGRLTVEASERAAESQGFAAKWGGRSVRQWTRVWIASRQLPISRQGRHAKVFSLLDDPAIKAELRAYVRTNKWAMDPARLQEFTAGKLIPAAADKYLKQLVHEEMPRGLKKYLETEIFPRAQLKVGTKGISLKTAERWLHKEGFKYIHHKKGLYFDGHDRPDVVDYRQNTFLPQMHQHSRRLVRYVVGDVGQELFITPDNYVERRLVLLSHDEMTAQTNDGQGKSWVLEDQHVLRKKGVGRGLHRSDVICSTVGHIPEAGEMIEYGKNYDGYWTGEKFVIQLGKRIIPSFEERHGAGYQALVMVDNSQGHSAYPEDALLISRMNAKPGGKQARMRDGWFIKDGRRVPQSMVFPANHSQYPNEPKGMKYVLAERGFNVKNLRGKCKNKCEVGAVMCCCKRLLELQPDFLEQKSLVQEVIEEAGHLCIFLPKFHCELNFIEFFWG
ncbi:hypothetical protein R3P38DRAFT_3449566, partial [Favolaschia claudopus]